MKYEGSSNREVDNNNDSDVLEQTTKGTSWSDHLKKARGLLRQRIFGEKTKGQVYRLDEQCPEPALKKLYERWDDYGVEIPLELGKMMEEYINNPDYRLGIHRSGLIDGKNYASDDILHSSITKGIQNLGDQSSGAIRKDPSVGKTAFICPNMLDAVITLKSPYKGSTGAVLVAIPSELIDEEGKVKPGMNERVYNHDQYGNSLLKPEFVLGFAQNLGKGTTIKYISKEELLKNYPN